MRLCFSVISCFISATLPLWRLLAKALHWRSADKVTAALKQDPYDETLQMSQGPDSLWWLPCMHAIYDQQTYMRCLRGVGCIIRNPFAGVVWFHQRLSLVQVVLSCCAAIPYPLLAAAAAAALLDYVEDPGAARLPFFDKMVEPPLVTPSELMRQ